MHSSTRVGSVALLGNQEKVEYYRNDSPVGEVVSKAVNGKAGDEAVHNNHIAGCRVVMLIVGGGLLKYCRREEERKKSRNEGGLARVL